MFVNIQYIYAQQRQKKTLNENIMSMLVSNYNIFTKSVLLFTKQSVFHKINKYKNNKINNTLKYISRR